MRMHSVWALGALLAASTLLPDAAQAGPRGEPPGLTFQQGGVGCYWYRGRRHCSRYCYLEVDGIRYCQRRERDAVSQAPFSLFEPPFAVEPPRYRGVK